jgi:hypothetical protein
MLNAKWRVGGLVGLFLIMVVAAIFLMTRSDPVPSISGHVWLTTAKGESNIQRGATVHLMRGKVTAVEIRKAAEGKLAEVKRRAASASENSGIGEDAKAIEAMIAGVTGEVTVYDALLMLNNPKYATYGDVRLEDFVSPATLKTTTADVNGFYEFPRVDNGYYIVAAEIGGGLASQIVIVQGKPQTIDLH